MTVRAELDLLSDDITARQGRMAARVFDALKLAIVQLRLRPGYLLSEADVARQLGVSRQPVREAFIMLAEVGLVEVRPQRGTFVMLISIKQVQNVRFIREAIESAVVRKAAVDGSAPHIEELQRLLDLQRGAARDSDQHEFLRLDEIFHQTLAHSANADYAWRVLENLKAQMDRVRYLSMPDATPISILIEQHDAIIDAIVRHSPDDAQAAMQVHLHEISNSLPRLAQAHPDLFSA